VDVHAITHFKFFIDSDEVTNQRVTLSANSSPNMEASLRCVIPIGGTASTATGRQATWTTAKTLKLQFRAYGTGNEGKIYTNTYWDGAGTAYFNQPKMIITAYG
jgi:hypothetical protein